MSFINDQDIIDLINASRDYKCPGCPGGDSILTPPPSDDALKYKDPDNLSYMEFASILRSKGWDNTNPATGESFTDENFVLQYIFGDPRHPEREAYLDILDEEIPESLATPYEEPGIGSKLFGTGEDIAHNIYAISPSWAAGGLAAIAKEVDYQAGWFTEIDFNKFGEAAYNGDIKGINKVLEDASRNYVSKYEAGRYDYKIGDALILPLGRNLERVEAIHAARAKDVMDEHRKDPKNRAYWEYMSKVRAKNFRPFTENSMSMSERFAYMSSALTTPIMSTAVGLVTFARTRDPKLAMQVAGSMSFVMEGTDEWQQCFSHHIKQGYSPENASRMCHLNATLYGASAYYIEKLPMTAFLPKKAVSKIKDGVWKSMVQKTGKYMDEVLEASPKLKAISNNKFGNFLVKQGIRSGAEALEEGTQLTVQGAIQSGYKGDEAWEGYAAELAESMRAGALAGGGMGTITSMLGLDTDVADIELTALEKKEAVELPSLDKESLLIAKFTRKTDILSDADKDALTQISSKDLRSPGKILEALKKKGSAVLEELGIDTEDITGQLEKIFPDKPQYVSEALKWLKVEPTTTKEEKVQEEPITGEKPPSKLTGTGLEGLGFEEEDYYTEEETVEADVKLPEYESLTKKQLQAEIQNRKDQGVKISKTGTKAQLVKALKDNDAIQEAAVEETGEIPAGVQVERVWGLTEEEMDKGETGQAELPLETPAVEEEAPAEDKILLRDKQGRPIQRLTKSGTLQPLDPETGEPIDYTWSPTIIKTALDRMVKSYLGEHKGDRALKRISMHLRYLGVGKGKGADQSRYFKSKFSEEELKNISNWLNSGIETIDRETGERLSMIAVPTKEGGFQEVSFPRTGTLLDFYDQYVEELEAPAEEEFMQKEGEEYLRTKIITAQAQLETAKQSKRKDKADLIRVGEKNLAKAQADYDNFKQEAPAEDVGLTDEDIAKNFQQLGMGRFPLMREAQEQAERIVASLKEKYPEVETLVRNILRDEAGTEIAGVSIGAVAAWSRQGAKLDTPPHEYAHVFIRALANDPVVRKAINQFKEKGMTDKQAEEKLVQYIGEYYATNTIAGKPKGFISNFKTFLRKFWTRIKKLLGKPSEYVAEQFFERGEMFKTDAVYMGDVLVEGDRAIDMGLAQKDKDRAKIEAIQAKHEVRLIGTTIKSLQSPLLDTKKPIKIDGVFIDAISGIKFSKKEKDGVVYSQWRFGIKAAERELLQQVVLAEGLADTRMTADEFKAVVLKYIYPMSIAPKGIDTKEIARDRRVDIQELADDYIREGMEGEQAYLEAEALVDEVRGEYGYVTVSGGVNYREYTFQFPFKVHGANHDFGPNSIGWFRADELEGDPTVLRVQEIQADILQKAARREGQIAELAEQEAYIKAFGKGAWDIYFAKSIIQWAATQGYSAVYFPTMKTLAKVEGFISGGAIAELNITAAEEQLEKSELDLFNAEGILTDLKESDRLKNTEAVVNKWIQSEINKAKNNPSSGKVKTQFSDPDLQQFGFGMGGLEKGHTITLDDGNKDKYGMGQHTSYWWNEKEQQWYVQKHHTSAWTNEGVPIDAEYFTMSYSGARGWSDSIGKQLHTDEARKKLGDQIHGKPIHVDIINAAAEEMIYEAILNQSVPTIQGRGPGNLSKQISVLKQLEDAILREADIRSSVERLKTTIEHARLAQADIEAGAKENQVDLSNFPDSQATVMKHYRTIRKAMFRDRMDNTEIVVDSKGNTWVKTLIRKEDADMDIPLYQQLIPESKNGKRVLAMLDNAFNSMIARTGKKIPIGEYVRKLAGMIPDDIAIIFADWKSKHSIIKKAKLMRQSLRNTAGNNVFATAEEFDQAFDQAVEEFEQGLDALEPNDKDVIAKNSGNVEWSFLHALGTHITADEMKSLLNAAWLKSKDTTLSAQDAFMKWANEDLYKYTGFKYNDYPASRTGKQKRRRIKQLYVRAASSIRVNNSTLRSDSTNMEFNVSTGVLVIKGETSTWTEETNHSREQNRMYQATDADKTWKSDIIWLNTKDIYETLGSGLKEWHRKYGTTLTDGQIKLVAQKALEMEFADDDVFGMVMIGVRGDAGHMMFTPIRSEHLDNVTDPASLKAYWKDKVDQGIITKEQARHHLGWRQDDKGNWKKTRNASQKRWLAAEMARMDAMLELMPSDMINNGAEFMRRVKIASTPVFTSPLMNDFKGVIIAKGDEKNDLVFVDKAGNEAPMVEAVPGMGSRNRTDGASIGGLSFFENFWNAFGANDTRKVSKNVIWNPDKKIAVKHETFMPEAGLKIMRKVKGKASELIAEVDEEGNIFIFEGEKRVQVDMLMTDDEAKYSDYNSLEVFDVKGNEFGLIKYNSKKGNAKFPTQWFNYIDDPVLRKEIMDALLPRVHNAINRLFTMTGSSQQLPQLIYKFIKSIQSDSPHAITNSFLEKAKLGLGSHADGANMLNKLYKTQIMDRALTLADGTGTYLDIAPDYTGTHAENEVSISIDDADAVLQQYADTFGGTVAEAREMGIRRLNQWLAETPVRALISRSPIPYVGGIFVGRIKSLHNRGGQAILNADTVTKRLEGDNDGDAVQIEFLDSALLDSIDTYLQKAENNGRMKPINLKNLTDKDMPVNDLSKIENMYSLVHKFILGSRAISQIANVQVVFGQLNIVFNHAKIGKSFIQLKDLTKTKVNFAEAGIKNTTMEYQLRHWIQAAVDNGKHLLLDKWNYDRDTLYRRMFAVTDGQGNYQREINDDEWNVLSTMVYKHLVPNSIRNGRNNNGAYTIKSLLLESALYKLYAANRQATLDPDIDGLEVAYAFNDEIAPMEEIAMAFANMWYGDIRTGQIARIEPGKEDPVFFSEEIYNSVHVQSMRNMQAIKVQDMREAKTDEEAMIGDLSEADVAERISNGEKFANRMWKSEGDENGLGIGFVKLLDDMGDSIGPKSWDHNPELIKFTDYWNAEFMELSPIERAAATYRFLEGFYQYNKETGKVKETKNRRVLPPISSNEIYSVLDGSIVAKYLAQYNTLINDVEARQQDPGRFTSYVQADNLIKKICR